MQTRFYVAHNEKQVGPYTSQEIIGKLKTKELVLTDYWYDESAEDWRMLMEGAQWSNYETAPTAIKSSQPLDPLQPFKENQEKFINFNQEVDPELAPNLEWYVLKGNNKFGPFTYFDLVGMLQEKHLFEFDYVWYSGMESWKRVAELSCFHPAKIRALHNKSLPPISELFFRRRHKRANFGGSIVAHNNKKMWKGEGIEISAGGAGLMLQNALLMPGDTIYLHFKPGDGVPPFNAICEVISKEYVPNVNDPSTPIRYGVKFTSINQDAQRLIRQFAQKIAA